MTPTEPRAAACLDHAATTPMHPDALEVMAWHLATAGNPSALHTSGRNAHAHGVPVHSDAVGAVGQVAVDFHKSGVDARCNLRVTLGHTTTQAEVDTFVDAIAPVVERARARSFRTGGLIRVRQGVPG